MRIGTGSGTKPSAGLVRQTSRQRRQRFLRRHPELADYFEGRPAHLMAARAEVRASRARLTLMAARACASLLGLVLGWGLWALTRGRREQ